MTLYFGPDLAVKFICCDIHLRAALCRKRDRIGIRLVIEGDLLYAPAADGGGLRGSVEDVALCRFDFLRGNRGAGFQPGNGNPSVFVGDKFAAVLANRPAVSVCDQEPRSLYGRCSPLDVLLQNQALGCIL